MAQSALKVWSCAVCREDDKSLLRRQKCAGRQKSGDKITSLLRRQKCAKKKTDVKSSEVEFSLAGKWQKHCHSEWQVEFSAVCREGENKIAKKSKCTIQAVWKVTQKWQVEFSLVCREFSLVCREGANITAKKINVQFSSAYLEGNNKTGKKRVNDKLNWVQSAEKMKQLLFPLFRIRHTALSLLLTVSAVFQFSVLF